MDLKDSKVALNFINSLFEQNQKPVLNELESKLFIGCWENKSYKDIAAETCRVEQSEKEAGLRLFKKIKEDLRIEVDKRNFVNPIKRRYQEYNLQSAPTIPPTQEPTRPNPSPPIPSKINPFMPTNGRVENLQHREPEITRTFEILNGRGSVALIGETGIGKSSLLWAIHQQAANYLHPSRKSVFLDLNDVHNETELYQALCDEVGIEACQGYSFARNLRRHNQKILLILDNVGKLTWEGFTRHVRDQLRGLAEGNDAPLRLVLAATEPLDKLFEDSQDNGKTSPLAGICREETINPWDEITARNFIAIRLQNYPVQFTEAEITQLIQDSGGHPQRLMKLCHQTYACYLNRKP
jgi:hypothetical protein